MFFLTSSIFGASSNGIDSLKQKIENTTIDTSKVILLNKLANEYRINDNLNLAKECANRALIVSNKINWPYGKALSFNNIAYINIYESNFDATMKNAVKALQIAEINNDKENLGFAYLYIGYVKMSVGEYDEALPYFLKALKIREELKNNYNLGFSLSYLGNYYNILKNYDSSLYYHSLALEARLKTQDSRSIADSYLLSGSAFFKLKKYTEALKNYDLALIKYTTINDKRRLAETYRNYAEVYLHKNELDIAKEYLSKSLNIAYEIGVLENLIPIYSELALLHEKKQEYKNAYRYLRKHIEYKDSTINSTVFRTVTKQIFKYKTEKEKVIQEKNQAILLAKNETQRYILFGAIGIIIILGGFAYFIARTLKTTRSQKTIIEEQTIEIVDSITYAKRIQDAILPTASYIKECLPKSFVFYKPKDIVAGDFYWIEKKNEFIIFAVADCTGHGVPGAMMSVVCHNALDRAVREDKLILPNQILDKTLELIVNQLNKVSHNSDSRIRDGMDIALCVLNTKTNLLYYTGAYNPLWVLKNRNETIEELKADRQSLKKIEKPKPYTLHEILLNPGDTVYLFSDGFADQFGGVKGRKLMRNPFKQLLISIGNDDMASQQLKIETFFNKWKGKHNQIDDVCVMGVRI